VVGEVVARARARQAGAGGCRGGRRREAACGSAHLGPARLADGAWLGLGDDERRRRPVPGRPLPSTRRAVHARTDARGDAGRVPRPLGGVGGRRRREPRAAALRPGLREPSAAERTPGLLSEPRRSGSGSSPGSGSRRAAGSQSGSVRSRIRCRRRSARSSSTARASGSSPRPDPRCPVCAGASLEFTAELEEQRQLMCGPHQALAEKVRNERLARPSRPRDRVEARRHACLSRCRALSGARGEAYRATPSRARHVAGRAHAWGP
jgi:hypothetical protein